MDACSEEFQKVWPLATVKARNKRIMGGLVKWLDKTPIVREAEFQVFISYCKDEDMDPIASPPNARFMNDFLDTIVRLGSETALLHLLKPHGEMIDMARSTTWSKEHAGGTSEKDWTLKNLRLCGAFSDEDDWVLCMQHTGTNYASVGKAAMRLKTTWSGSKVWKRLFSPSCHHYMDQFMQDKLKSLDSVFLTKQVLDDAWLEVKKEAEDNNMINTIDTERICSIVFISLERPWQNALLRSVFWEASTMCLTYMCYSVRRLSYDRCD